MSCDNIPTRSTSSFLFPSPFLGFSRSSPHDPPHTTSSSRWSNPRSHGTSSRQIPSVQSAVILVRTPESASARVRSRSQDNWAGVPSPSSPFFRRSLINTSPAKLYFHVIGCSRRGPEAQYQRQGRGLSLLAFSQARAPSRGAARWQCRAPQTCPRGYWQA